MLSGALLGVDAPSGRVGPSEGEVRSDGEVPSGFDVSPGPLWLRGPEALSTLEVPVLRRTLGATVPPTPLGS
ncbi:hypothetical protein [Streptomyces longispororuber]|uniref:hypothetical protein n=1 Tax=Streptomyces longispororuber TaxID=68230 RepID=UPI0037001831